MFIESISGSSQQNGLMTQVLCTPLVLNCFARCASNSSNVSSHAVTCMRTSLPKCFNDDGLLCPCVPSPLSRDTQIGFSLCGCCDAAGGGGGHLIIYSRLFDLLVRPCTRVLSQTWVVRKIFIKAPSLLYSMDKIHSAVVLKWTKYPRVSCRTECLLRSFLKVTF